MQRDPIKLYWWDRLPNMGDVLGRDVVEFASGRKVVHTAREQADLLSIGSILNFVQDGFGRRKLPYLVWGSGSLGNGARTRQEFFVCSAVRGPLTLGLMQNHSPIPFGDPGILTSAMWPHAGGKTYRWGLVPHWSQLEEPWVKQMMDETPNITLIDVRDPDMRLPAGKLRHVNSLRRPACMA